MIPCSSSPLTCISEEGCTDICHLFCGRMWWKGGLVTGTCSRASQHAPLAAGAPPQSTALTCWAMALMRQYSASALGEEDGAATRTWQPSPLKLSVPLWKQPSKS